MSSLTSKESNSNFEKSTDLMNESALVEEGSKLARNDDVGGGDPPGSDKDNEADDNDSEEDEDKRQGGGDDDNGEEAVDKGKQNED